jgi:acyl-CoA reductase-like NAD-dependent aldehyde dehydrogenase
MKMRPGTQTGFLLCGKEWTEGEALEVRSPWDQGLVGRVTVATRSDARQAVHHAAASMRRTRALPRWKRREILEDVAAALIEQKERFAQLIVAEAGKPVRLARSEVDRAVLTFKAAAEETSRLGGESIPLDLTEGNEGRWGLVQRFPVGPVLAITPFNFPLNLVAHKVAPAMAAGCPIILKPAPQTPFTSLALGEVILKAGWPDEALAVLPLSNVDTAWLAEKEDRIKLVSFTGSAKVGWELKAAGTGRQRGHDRARRLAGPGRSGGAHGARGVQLRGPVLRERAAGFCGAAHLPDLAVEGGRGDSQAGGRQSVRRGR